MASDPQPYYGPNESALDIAIEQMFVAADFIVGVGYGVQLVLYTSCVLFLWRTRHSRGRQCLVLITYMTLLLLIETLFCIVQARSVQLMYIDNRNYPGGPWQYFLDTQNLPINVMFYATLFVLTFLADLLVLWRCWVVYSASGRTIACIVIACPTIMLLCSFVMGTLWTLQSSQPGLSLYSALPLAYGTSYYVISLSVNIVLTVLITVRLLLYRRRACVVGIIEDKGKHYISLATIFVESAALYSVTALVFIVTYAVGNPANQVFLAVASAAQQIAGYLIIYRVAEGTAWSHSSYHSQKGSSYSGDSHIVDLEKGRSRKLSNLRFASSNSAKTQHTISDISTSPTTLGGIIAVDHASPKSMDPLPPVPPIPILKKSTSASTYSTCVGSIFVEDLDMDVGLKLEIAVGPLDRPVSPPLDRPESAVSADSCLRCESCMDGTGHVVVVESPVCERVLEGGVGNSSRWSV